MHRWLNLPGDQDADWEKMLGIRFKWNKSLQTIRRTPMKKEFRFEVQSVRISRRHSPDGEVLPQLIVQVVQARRGYFDPDIQKLADKGKLKRTDPRSRRGDFTFRGGATLIVDLRDGHVKRVIRKRIDDDRRLARVRGFKLGDPAAMGFDYQPASAQAEPFALLHRGCA
jgi:hypothetical protein